jgi:ubiquinone/menaquinone biosynthesis C-methylase UbiE
VELGGWYDRFASVYDASVERVYAPYRARIAEAVAAPPGGTVIDVACGTGPNLPHLARAVGPSGRVLGVDLSPGMLRRAEPIRAAHPQVELVCADLATFEPTEPIDAMVSTLGVSVIPSWEQILDRMWALVRPGGRMVVFDIHAESFVPQSYVVRFRICSGGPGGTSRRAGSRTTSRSSTAPRTSTAAARSSWWPRSRVSSPRGDRPEGPERGARTP